MKKYQMAFHLFCLSLLLSAPCFAGVLNLQFIDASGRPIPYVTINYTGNYVSGSSITDAEGIIAIQYPYPPSPSGCGSWNTGFYPEKPGFRFELERGDYFLRVPCSTAPVTNLQITGTDLPPLISVSAADYQARFTNEMIATAFGDGLATRTELATLPLKTTLGGRSLLVRDSAGTESPAILLFVSPTQINYITPIGLPLFGRVVAKLVDESGNVLKVGFHSVNRVSPSIFTADANGRGAPAASVVRASSGYQVYESVAEFDQIQQKAVPATIDLGPESEIVVLALFGTGWRQVAKLADVHINIGGIDCPAEFAGKQTTVEGLDQINVRLPRTLIGKGDVTLQLDIGGSRANPVQLKFK